MNLPPMRFDLGLRRFLDGHQRADRAVVEQEADRELLAGLNGGLRQFGDELFVDAVVVAKAGACRAACRRRLGAGRSGSRCLPERLC